MLDWQPVSCSGGRPGVADQAAEFRDVNNPTRAQSGEGRAGRSCHRRPGREPSPLGAPPGSHSWETETPSAGEATSATGWNVFRCFGFRNTCAESHRNGLARTLGNEVLTCCSCSKRTRWGGACGRVTACHVSSRRPRRLRVPAFLRASRQAPGEVAGHLPEMVRQRPL